MFRRTRKVLVAFSGGPDSLATLLVIRALGGELGFDVEACHFDHQLRPESRSDMERARNICAELGVECVTGEGDVRGVAQQMKRGIEEMAREMRYQFLAFVAEKEGADCIVTGHTSDDQAETILMRVIRGSGVRGIRGMLPVSAVPGATSQRLIRPVLETPRASTVAICAEFGITPIEDSSNSDPAFSRNRVRNETLAGLRGLNPSVSEALIGLGKSATEAFDPIEKQSYQAQPSERGPIGAIFDARSLQALSSGARSLVIEREASFYHLRPELNRTRLENLGQVLARGSGQVQFGDTCLEVSCGKVRLGPRLETVQPLTPTIVSIPGDTRAGDWVVRVRTEPLPEDPANPGAALDSETFVGLVKLRSVLPGDTIRWHGKTRHVSDLLVNQKVPQWERPSIVALADGAGILALFGASGVYARDGAAADMWVRIQPIGQR